MGIRIAVIYYSSTGNVYALANAVAEGALLAGAEVRLRRVPELAPAEAVDQNSVWRKHLNATLAVEEAALSDLIWADGFAFGTPTRFGAPAAQLKQFIDQTGPLWHGGQLANKPATAFTSAYNRHGGNEATILALSNVFYHWGSLIVPPGYTDPAVSAAGGNPYGATYVTSTSSSTQGPDFAALEAARHQGRRLTEMTTSLVNGRSIGSQANATSNALV